MSAVSTRAAAAGRTAAGALVLLALLAWVGPAAFFDGAAAVGPVSLAAVAVLTVAATWACGWRWHLVAGGLGVGLTPAVAALRCYRAQAVNLTVPGGVVGDLHRGIHHGRVTGRTSLALRSVVWERTAGQVVQAAALVVVLVLLPGVLPGTVTVLVLVAVLALTAVVLGLVSDRWPAEGRLRRAIRQDLRAGVVPRAVWPGLLLTSVAALTAHVAAFAVAARAVGVAVSPASLLPLAMVVLTAAALPVGVAGWGPREGTAAWAFDAAGLGAAAGVATATAYGCLVLVVHLPGLALLLLPDRGGLARATAERGRVRG